MNLIKNILLVGGGGYVGTVLTKFLLSKGFYVKCFDNFIYNHSSCVSEFIGKKKYELLKGNILNKNNLSTALEGIDYVVLLAGLVGDQITTKYPEESNLINNIGIRNVIDLCAKHNSEKFIFVSTCSNYGLIENNMLADENNKLRPLSLYAKSKVNAEKYIFSLKDKTDMNPTILRFATAFGKSPRMRFDLTVSEFTLELAKGKELVVYDAQTWRPYCHLEDFTRLIEMVIEAPKEKVAWEVFNAGGDINNATKQMVVNQILEKLPKAKVLYQDHGSDPRNYRVSFEKVKSILGFEPKYTIQYGIDELINAIDSNMYDFVEKNRNFFGNYEIKHTISL